MGNIVLAAKATHVPSLLLSEREGPLKGSRDQAIQALRELGRRARKRGARTFLVLDTHWIANFGLHVNANARHRGVYTSPEAPHMIQGLRYDYGGDWALAVAIADEARREGLSVLAHAVPTLGLEYGTIVPMHYMNEEGALNVVSIAASIFASPEENRQLGEAIFRAVSQSNHDVALIASGSLSHKLWRNSELGPDAWTSVSSEFNRQMDLRVLELWQQRRYREFLALLPAYAEKCNGEANMADTVAMFGALGWDRYEGKAEQLCDYFGATGSGQAVVEFAFAA